MARFEESEWAEGKHARDFVQNADIYILERKRLLRLVQSFYRNFQRDRLQRPTRLLDLGCGNGEVTMALLEVDDEIEAQLVDGSSEMLKIAQERLKSYKKLNYIHTTFQDLIKEDILTTDFDFVISSLAIHHLHTEEKKALFNSIHHQLAEGGFFLNIDVIKAPAGDLEDWYRMLWKEWIAENEALLKPEKSFQYLPDQYKNNPDNHPDTLEKQLNILRSAGFKQVDCYYKYGIFSIYGGRK